MRALSIAAVWSGVLIFFWLRAPKSLPNATRLARIAILCLALGLPYAWYAALTGYRWSPADRGPVQLLGALGGLGLLPGLLLGGLAFILDARRRSAAINSAPKE